MSGVDDVELKDLSGPGSAHQTAPVQRPAAARRSTACVFVLLAVALVVLGGAGVAVWQLAFNSDAPLVALTSAAIGTSAPAAVLANTTSGATTTGTTSLSTTSATSAVSMSVSVSMVIAPTSTSRVLATPEPTIAAVQVFPTCGDGVCDATERALPCGACRSDCGLCCVNSICERASGETADSCAADCRGIDVVRTSPESGELDVNPHRELVFEFSHAVALAPACSNDSVSAWPPVRVRVRGDDAALVPPLRVASARVSAARTQLRVVLAESMPSGTVLLAELAASCVLGADDRAGEPVDADGDGAPGGALAVAFSTLRSAVVPGTALFGWVRDSFTREPLSGVRFLIEETGLTTRSNASGFFELAPLPAPRVFVFIDGSTVTNGARIYAALGKAFHSVAGERRQLEMDKVPFDVYLPPMDMQDFASLSGAPGASAEFGFGPAALQDAMVNGGIRPTVASLARVVLDDGAAQASDARAAPATQATMVFVPGTRLPAPLPPSINASEATVFSIQVRTSSAEGGGIIRFDPPARVVWPNTNNLPPNSTTALLSFDHERGDWFTVGRMQVSGDGRVLRTIEGGVLAPGWHVVAPQPTRSVSVNAGDLELYDGICGIYGPGGALDWAEKVGETADVIGSALDLQEASELIEKGASLAEKKLIRFAERAVDGRFKPHKGSKVSNKAKRKALVQAQFQKGRAFIGTHAKKMRRALAGATLAFDLITTATAFGACLQERFYVDCLSQAGGRLIGTGLKPFVTVALLAAEEIRPKLGVALDVVEALPFATFVLDQFGLDLGLDFDGLPNDWETLVGALIGDENFDAARDWLRWVDPAGGAEDLRGVCERATTYAPPRRTRQAAPLSPLQRKFVDFLTACKSEIDFAATIQQSTRESYLANLAAISSVVDLLRQGNESDSYVLFNVVNDTAMVDARFRNLTLGALPIEENKAVAATGSLSLDAAGASGDRVPSTSSSSAVLQYQPGTLVFLPVVLNTAEDLDAFGIVLPPSACIDTWLRHNDSDAATERAGARLVVLLNSTSGVVCDAKGLGVSRWGQPLCAQVCASSNGSLSITLVVSHRLAVYDFDAVARNASARAMLMSTSDVELAFLRSIAPRFNLFVSMHAAPHSLLALTWQRMVTSVDARQYAISKRVLLQNTSSPSDAVATISDAYSAFAEAALSAVPLRADPTNLRQPAFVSVFVGANESDDASAMRLRTNAAGALPITVPSSRPLSILAYSPELNAVTRRLVPAGVSATAATLAFNLPDQLFDVDAVSDFDGDGLSDLSERAIGTLLNDPDSDRDGVGDFDEIQRGTDPLGGVSLPRGVLAALQVPTNNVRDVRAEGDRVIVCTDEGVVVVDIALALEPRVMWRAALPGGCSVVIGAAAAGERDVVWIGDTNGLLRVERSTADGRGILTASVVLRGVVGAVHVAPHALLYAVAGSNVIALDDSALSIVAVTNIGLGSTAVSVADVAFALYVSWSDGRVCSYDVSDFAFVRSLGNCATWPFPPTSSRMAVSGDGRWLHAVPKTTIGMGPSSFVAVMSVGVVAETGALDSARTHRLMEFRPNGVFAVVSASRNVLATGGQSLLLLDASSSAAGVPNVFEFALAVDAPQCDFLTSTLTFVACVRRNGSLLIVNVLPQTVAPPQPATPRAVASPVGSSSDVWVLRALFDGGTNATHVAAVEFGVPGAASPLRDASPPFAVVVTSEMLLSGTASAAGISAVAIDRFGGRSAVAVASVADSPAAVRAPKLVATSVGVPGAAGSLSGVDLSELMLTFDRPIRIVGRAWLQLSAVGATANNSATMAPLALRAADGGGCRTHPFGLCVSFGAVLPAGDYRATFVDSSDGAVVGPRLERAQLTTAIRFRALESRLLPPLARLPGAVVWIGNPALARASDLVGWWPAAPALGALANASAGLPTIVVAGGTAALELDVAGTMNIAIVHAPFSVVRVSAPAVIGGGRVRALDLTSTSLTLTLNGSTLEVDERVRFVLAPTHVMRIELDGAGALVCDSLVTELVGSPSSIQQTTLRAAGDARVLVRGSVLHSSQGHVLAFDAYDRSDVTLNGWPAAGRLLVQAFGRARVALPDTETLLGTPYAYYYAASGLRAFENATIDLSRVRAIQAADGFAQTSFGIGAQDATASVLLGSLESVDGRANLFGRLDLPRLANLTGVSDGNGRAGVSDALSLPSLHTAVFAELYFSRGVSVALPQLATSIRDLRLTLGDSASVSLPALRNVTSSMRFVARVGRNSSMTLSALREVHDATISTDDASATVVAPLLQRLRYSGPGARCLVQLHAWPQALREIDGCFVSIAGTANFATLPLDLRATAGTYRNQGADALELQFRGDVVARVSVIDDTWRVYGVKVSDRASLTLVGVQRIDGNVSSAFVTLMVQDSGSLLCPDVTDVSGAVQVLASEFAPSPTLSLPRLERIHGGTDGSRAYVELSSALSLRSLFNGTVIARSNVTLSALTDVRGDVGVAVYRSAVLSLAALVDTSAVSQLLITTRESATVVVSAVVTLRNAIVQGRVSLPVLERSVCERTSGSCQLFIEEPFVLPRLAAIDGTALQLVGSLGSNLTLLALNVDHNLLPGVNPSVLSASGPMRADIGVTLRAGAQNDVTLQAVNRAVFVVRRLDRVTGPFLAQCIGVGSSLEVVDLVSVAASSGRVQLSASQSCAVSLPALVNLTAPTFGVQCDGTPSCAVSLPALEHAASTSVGSFSQVGLPSLRHASGVYFSAFGVALELTNLRASTGLLSLRADQNGAVSLPALTSSEKLVVVAQTGGSVRLPLLSEAQQLQIDASAGRVEAPQLRVLRGIDDASFPCRVQVRVAAGATLSPEVAWLSGVERVEWCRIDVTGAGGSTLRMANLTAFVGACGVFVDSAALQLSVLSGSMHNVDLYATNGANVIVDAALSVSANRTGYIIATGGAAIDFRNTTALRVAPVAGPFSIHATGAASRIRFPQLQRIDSQFATSLSFASGGVLDAPMLQCISPLQPTPIDTISGARTFPACN
jgi:hypothetical protein